MGEPTENRGGARLGCAAELDDEIAAQILWLGLAALFPSRAR
jgi:hypothetical protein